MNRVAPSTRMRALLPVVLVLALSWIPLGRGVHAQADSSLAQVRDGQLFDQGATRTEPAEGAPEALSRMASLIGQWDVEMVQHRPGQESLSSKGKAMVTYMNRGHAIMERTRFQDFDGQGNPMATITFLAVNGNGVWSASTGNSWTEAISIFSGTFNTAEAGEGSKGDEPVELLLYNSLRPGGGALLLQLRRSYRLLDRDGYEVTLEMSNDGGQSWTPLAEQRYRRRTNDPDFFPVREDVGLPDPERAEEAAEFDFLLGEFEATHWLTTPQGVRRWRANATAVHLLDGHAILEFSWHNLDPSLPDTATSILRLYNRSMRRWESLFLNNRNHTPLHFGGVREGQRIVLHPFAAQTGSNPLSQWIFFDQRPDAYRWKGLRSTDRGRSYQATWAIDFVRKGTRDDEKRLAPTPVSVGTRDRRRIYGDHLRPAQPDAPTVLLFHQAGSSAHGEYGSGPMEEDPHSIARRLQDEGFEVLAWDARAGGERFVAPNRTVVQQPEADPRDYCGAYPDLEAALEYAFEQGSGGPILAVGSSYSAALVVRLAAEHGNRLAGVASFSPASGRMGDCAVDTWLDKSDTPILAFRPASEMANAGVQRQAEQLRERQIELFVADGGVHGASMLHPKRASGSVDATWERLLAFLRNPGGDAQ